MERDFHHIELESMIVIQLMISGVSCCIIICMEWLFAPMDLILMWQMNIFKIIKSQRSNIIVKLVYDYNQTKQMPHDLVLNNGNSVDGKAWLIIVWNGFEKLTRVPTATIYDLFDNTNLQNKMNKIICKCSINDNLIVEVHAGDDGCSWIINILIDKCRMCCNNLGKRTVHFFQDDD